ncbi:hypothetical protein H4R35_004944 [Dimargaris xerosporica]|nr:hypothetical protein H4R35_004944 [Dimargaris xerosporica]
MWSYQSSSPRYPFLYAHTQTARAERPTTTLPGTPQQHLLGSADGICQSIPAVVSAIATLPPAKSLVQPPPAPVLRSKRSLFSLGGLTALFKASTMFSGTPRKSAGVSSAGISSASYTRSATELSLSRTRNPEFLPSPARQSWIASSSASACFELSLTAAEHTELVSRGRPQSWATGKPPSPDQKVKKRGKSKKPYASVDDDDDDVVLDDATSDLLMDVMDYKGYSRYPTCLRPRRDRLRQLRQLSPRPNRRSLPNLAKYQDQRQPVARCVSYCDPSTYGLEIVGSSMPSQLEGTGKWPATTGDCGLSSLPEGRPVNPPMTAMSPLYLPVDQAAHSLDLPHTQSHTQGWSAPTSPRRLRSKPLPAVPQVNPSTPMPDPSTLKLASPVMSDSRVVMTLTSPPEMTQRHKFSSSYFPVERKPMSPVLEENESTAPSQASFDSAVSVSMAYAGESAKSVGNSPTIDALDVGADPQSRPASVHSQQSLRSVVPEPELNSTSLPAPSPQSSFYHPQQSPQSQSKPMPEPLSSISGLTDIPFQTNSVRSKTGYHGDLNFGPNLGNQSPLPTGSPEQVISNSCSSSPKPLSTTEQSSELRLVTLLASNPSLLSNTSSLSVNDSSMLSASTTPCPTRKALPLLDHTNLQDYSEVSRVDQEIQTSHCHDSSAKDVSSRHSVGLGPGMVDNNLCLKPQTSCADEPSSFDASVYRSSQVDGADDWDALRASMLESMTSYQPRHSPSRPGSRSMLSVPDGGYIDCYRTPTPSSPRTRVALPRSPATPSKDEDSSMVASLAASPNVSYLQLTPHKSKVSPVIGYRTQRPVSRDGVMRSPSLCRLLQSRPVSRSQSLQPSTATTAGNALPLAASSTSALLMPLSERPVRVKPKEWSGPHSAKSNRVRPPQFPRLTPSSDGGSRQPSELVRKESFCVPSRSSSIVRFSPASSIRYCQRARVKELADFFAAK